MKWEMVVSADGCNIFYKSDDIPCEYMYFVNILFLKYFTNTFITSK